MEGREGYSTWEPWGQWWSPECGSFEEAPGLLWGKLPKVVGPSGGSWRVVRLGYVGEVIPSWRQKGKWGLCL